MKNSTSTPSTAPTTHGKCVCLCSGGRPSVCHPIWVSPSHAAFPASPIAPLCRPDQCVTFLSPPSTTWHAPQTPPLQESKCLGSALPQASSRSPRPPRTHTLHLLFAAYWQSYVSRADRWGYYRYRRITPRAGNVLLCECGPAGHHCRHAEDNVLDVSLDSMYLYIHQWYNQLSGINYWIAQEHHWGTKLRSVWEVATWMFLKNEDEVCHMQPLLQ